MSRHVEGPMEAFSAVSTAVGTRSSRSSSPFVAEQLREVPSRFGLLRARQRLVDHPEPLGNLPGAAKTRSQLGKKQTQVVMNGGLGQSLERRLEQL